MEPESIEKEEIETEVDPSKVSFSCSNCGADMSWDPEVDALSCEYCGEVVQIPRGEGTILERPLEEGENAEGLERGLGIDLRVKHCSNCGAQVTFDESSTSELCVYCGSPSVLDQQANRNALRPESLVPLQVDRGEVQANFQRWLRGLWFRPNSIKSIKRFDAVGVYVPFWTFDCAVHSSWSADAGHYYYVTQTYVVMVNGKPSTRTRSVRKVRWVPAWGERDDCYDDRLVLASRGLKSSLMIELGPFDTTELVPYRPEYLAGWRAEEYQIGLEEGWSQGQEAIVESQRHRCAGDVPGDTQRNLRVENRIRDVRWKHVLLPIWSLQYVHAGKAFTVLVHGQSGRVVGKAPFSWIKIVLAIAIVASAVAAVALFNS